MQTIPTESAAPTNSPVELRGGPDPRPFDIEYIDNPDQATLRSLTKQHTPCLQTTAVGSLNKVTRNKARMAKYTYILGTDANAWSQNVMDPAKGRDLIRRQREYIDAKGQMIAIDGYVGLGKRALGATYLYTPEGANIAGMQQILSFPRKDVETADTLARPFQPTFRLVYTPDFRPEDMPGGQCILVDMENWTTHVIGPDYFGESKKGVLRMLNHWVYLHGGLVLHAGAKAVTLPSGEKLTMTVMGLSGTGKTTTTFSAQGDLTEPIQDDMVTLWPNGELSITENGCFAKIEGLSAKSEPVIHAGTTSAEAWLENAWLNDDGTFDFFKAELTPAEVARVRDILIGTNADPVHVDKYISGEVKLADVLDSNGVPADGWDFVKWTGNGRSIIPMSSIPGAADLQNIPRVQSMGILNRDEGADAAMPGILRFTSPAQAAGYFMLGETSKTSAAGKERGKTRSPFTQPFFPAKYGLQAGRFREVAATMPGVPMWLMNTGYVGGDARSVKEGVGLKVKIRHSSAMLEAMLGGTVVWTVDPDFGYEVVDVNAPENAALLERVPKAILSPRGFYDEAGRLDEYEAWVKNMTAGRREFLENYHVDADIIEAVCR
ncbi:MAG: phosphoenolpyruvate carboxykinase (ATP) [Deltaproteobacteria bacterium]|nr:phosphoenolpyruvate carboxykinase (ATP) [Deltaproteobacteria bacterium]